MFNFGVHSQIKLHINFNTLTYIKQYYRILKHKYFLYKKHRDANYHVSNTTNSSVAQRLIIYQQIP
jgi:hypothetical protein